jgi:hypothetical protein
MNERWECRLEIRKPSGTSAPMQFPIPNRTRKLAGRRAIAAARRIYEDADAALAWQAGEIGRMVSRATMDAAKPKSRKKVECRKS